MNLAARFPSVSRIAPLPGLVWLLSVYFALGNIACWGQTVVVAPVTEEEVSGGHRFIGVVIAAREVVIGSAVDGRVLELFVNDGDNVLKPSTALAQLKTDTIGIEIKAARALQESRRQELAELEAGSRPEEILQAKARAAASAARLNFAIRRFERMKKLGDAVSEDEFESAKSDKESSEQLYEADKAAFDLAVAGPRPEAIAQARAALARQQEEVRRLESMQAKYTIRAPFPGFVVEKHTEEGAWVSRGDPIATVVELDPIEVEVSVPEKQISYLKIGADARIELDALPTEDFGHVFLGTVVRINPRADLRSRTFPVKVRLPNIILTGRPLLKAGMLADVTLPVGKPGKALLVPKDALVLDSPVPALPPPVVMKVTEKDGITTAEAIHVQLGVAVGSRIAVTSNQLTAGDRVIVLGNERVRPGQPIQIASEGSAPDASQEVR